MIGDLLIHGLVLIVIPGLSFLIAARAVDIRARIPTIVATGCAAAVASFALEIAGLWRPLRESNFASHHRLVVNWTTMLVGAWVPGTIASWKLMAVRLPKAAGCAAIAAVFYVVLCVAPYAILVWVTN